MSEEVTLQIQCYIRIAASFFESIKHSTAGISFPKRNKQRQSWIPNWILFDKDPEIFKWNSLWQCSIGIHRIDRKFQIRVDELRKSGIDAHLRMQSLHCTAAFQQATSKDLDSLVTHRALKLSRFRPHACLVHSLARKTSSSSANSDKPGACRQLPLGTSVMPPLQPWLYPAVQQQVLTDVPFVWQLKQWIAMFPCKEIF